MALADESGTLPAAGQAPAPELLREMVSAMVHQPRRAGRPGLPRLGRLL